MANKKLRKTAKNLKNIPKLKKQLAIFLAKTSILGEIDIHHILVYGHRGFLAMSVEQLTNRFDKYLEETSESVEYWEQQRAIKIANGAREHAVWDEDRKIEAKKALLKEAEMIMDEIFEQVALVE